MSDLRSVVDSNAFLDKQNNWKILQKYFKLAEIQLFEEYVN